MLVLKRAVGKKIVIGPPDNPIGTIEVVEACRGYAKLAFDFPKEIPVNREEVAALVAARTNVVRGSGVWCDAASTFPCAKCSGTIVEDSRMMVVFNDGNDMGLCRACGEAWMGGKA